MSKLKIKCLFLFAFMATLFASHVMAADGVISEGTKIVLDFGSFTGIVTIISTIVTQVFKAIPAIKETTIAKIAISVAIGIVICFVAWGLKISPAMSEVTTWYGSIIYGIAAGLSGCGFYDVVKAVAALFKKGDSSLHE